MRPIWKLSLPLLALWLGGCASSAPTTNRYLLPADAGSTDARVPTASTTTLLISSPRMADFLSNDGIVLQLDDLTLNEANSNLWAAPLSQQLERGMRDRLAQRLPGQKVLLARGNSPQDALTLEISVDRFQGHYAGYAIASGQWLLRDDQGTVVSYAPFNAQVDLGNDGYPALVRALGRSWDQVADDIAAGVRSTNS
ncbi:PqiC family protein [Halomonas binhaiensis]|uniref:Membrane integrity-associated transporter subunit PqiC n=1 Tax=Halomonas binhaiensis TaxID=2562282 RepID=A0A5C1NE53_9GAMM|nr:ABC-type transport auxiliary lipoprotein family protein [Halomonas binhaiensis]QEM81972.1 membrane integrity-associated transporter subunit PqiC [Halomonas binhaiensis]